MSVNHTTVLLALHLQNEVIHPEGRIFAGFGGPSGDRRPFIRAAQHVLLAATLNEIPRIFVRMAFRADGIDLPDNCELYRTVKLNEVMTEGSWGAEFFDELAPNLSSDIIISHNRVNAFYASELDSVLRTLGCGKLILFGVATHSVVEHSARHAVDMGYEVTVVDDACHAHPLQKHQASLASIENLVTVVNCHQLSFSHV